jgi:hypothetical protein
MPVTIDDMIRDAGRELGMRRAVYPKWVQSNRLSQEKADHQIACMDAIYAQLKRAKLEGWPP